MSVFVSSDDEDFKSLFTCVDSEEEDFETEMERERQSHVNGIHKAVPQTSDQSKSNGEEPDSEAKNDELLYDPNSDENDQKWVDNQRPKLSKPLLSSVGSTSSSTKVLKSDATLNCPACMALLCHDCQRHEIYRTQYRAMFVFNCKIDFTEKLQYKQKQKKRKRDPNSDVSNRLDTYFPVFCDQCNTQVAVYDADEIYHFFGVLASF